MFLSTGGDTVVIKNFILKNLKMIQTKIKVENLRKRKGKAGRVLERFYVGT